MQLLTIQRVVGALLALFSLTMLPPSFVAWLYHEETFKIFIDAFWVTLVVGLLVWLPVRRHKADLRLRAGFLIVVLFWFVLGVFGAFPFLYNPHLSVVDAVFESLSGLTTTGATVIVGIDDLPKSVLYYRQQLQWLGGMGIIVLAVAVLPMLGVGGMQLYRAEAPGPVKDNKLTPRLTETAKALWYIYLALTVICAASFWMAGMSVFDAIAHSFTTIATGGFSTHDASMGYFESPIIESVAMFFMFASGVNFSIHFFAWRRVSLCPYHEDSEFRFYAFTLLLVSLLVSYSLLSSDFYGSSTTAIQQALFQTISFATSTGFTTANFQYWPTFAPILLLLVGFIGGCAGSTAGGLKVIRVLLLIKQGVREIRRLVHPNALFPVKVGSKPVPHDVVDSIWGFFALYVMSFCIMSLVLTATGLDLVTSFSSVASCMNNMGPGLGDTAANYAGINSTAKWVLCAAMLLGRLEIFTLLVLFSPTYWRK